MKEENKKFPETLITLYFILFPIYMILKLQFGIITHFIVPIIYIVLIFLNKKQFTKKSEFIFLLAFFGISSLIGLIGYRKYLYNWAGLVYLLFVNTLPWFLVTLNVKSFDNIHEKLKSKLLYILLGNIALILYSILADRNMTGNMEISYSILPLVIFSLDIFFKDKKIKYLLYSILGALIILFCGSRGPLLCILIYMIVYFIMDFKRQKHLIILLSIISVIFTLNFNFIVDTTISILKNFNIESRTLYKLKNGDIMNDTGRSIIYDIAFDELNDHPITGVGLGVERIKINEKKYNFNKDMSSCYPHNLFIEVLVQYGYIIGIILILVFLNLIIKSYRKANFDERRILISFFSIEVVRLMISSSYLISPIFFMYLGLCVNIINRKKAENEKNSYYFS